MAAAGLAVGVLPLVSPLDAAGDQYLLSAHMLQHVLIGDLAPLLLVLAVRGPLVFFLVPPSLLRPLARSRRLRPTAPGALNASSPDRRVRRDLAARVLQLAPLRELGRIEDSPPRCIGPTGDTDKRLRQVQLQQHRRGILIK